MLQNRFFYTTVEWCQGYNLLLVTIIYSVGWLFDLNKIIVIRIIKS